MIYALADEPSLRRRWRNVQKDGYQPNGRPYYGLRPAGAGLEPCCIVPVVFSVPTVETELTDGLLESPPGEDELFICRAIFFPSARPIEPWKKERLSNPLWLFICCSHLRTLKATGSSFCKCGVTVVITKLHGIILTLRLKLLPRLPVTASTVFDPPTKDRTKTFRPEIFFDSRADLRSIYRSETTKLDSEMLFFISHTKTQER